MVHQGTRLTMVHIEPLEDGILGIVTALMDLAFTPFTAVTRLRRRCEFDVEGTSALTTNTAATETTNQFCRVTLEEDHMIQGQI